MSSEVLASTRGERSSYAIGKAIASSAVLKDDLTPEKIVGQTRHSVPEYVSTDESSQFKAGSVAVHKVTVQQHELTDSFLVVEFNATTAGQSARYVGLNVIKRAVLRSGAMVSEFEYRPWVSFVLSKCTPQQRRAFLADVGTQSASAQTVRIPLPFLWCYYAQGTPNSGIAVPTYKLSAPLEIELHLNPDAVLTDGGAGAWATTAYSTVRFVHEYRQCSPDVYASMMNVPFNAFGYDFQTTSASSALPATSQSRHDLSSFDGSSCAIIISPITATSEAVNDFYTHADGIRYQVLELNGSPLQRLEGNISSNTASAVIKYMAYKHGINNGIDASDDTFSHRSSLIAFGMPLVSAHQTGNDSNAPEFSGYLNVRDVVKIDYIATNSSASILKTFFLNVRYCVWAIESGTLMRKK